MILRRFTDFVLQGRTRAIVTAFGTAFIPIIGSISILMTALVTLRKGALEGVYVLIAATLPFCISFYLSLPNMDQKQFALIMLGIVIVSNVLTWAFAVILRQFNNWSFTVELAALLGVFIVAVVHLFYPDVQSWWATQLQGYFAKTVEVVSEMKLNANGDSSSEVDAQVIHAAKQYATGFLIVSVLFNSLLQLVVARWWQAVIFNPGGLRKELYQIRLGHITGAVFVVGIILAYIGNPLALDAMPILYAMFFVAGLSLLHSLVAITQRSMLWLIIIYMGIMWLVPLSIMIIALIALADTGLDFRKRFLL